MTKEVKKDIPVFNCFIWDFNGDKMKEYNIFNHLDREYHYTLEHEHYAELNPLPTNFEEAKEWCKNHLMYQYWSRCEYEWIAHGWPTQKNEEKIDIYREAMMNIDVIAKMFTKHYIEIPTMTDALVGTRVAKSETIAGDVYMYDKTTDTNFWMRPSIYTNNIGNEKYTSDRYQAIAVVAIPASHNVYGTGEVGMVSLNYMSGDYPETGNLPGKRRDGICWGGHFDRTEVDKSTKVPAYASSSDSLTVASEEYLQCLPSDIFTNLRFDGDGVDTTGGYHDIRENCIPSPYTQDGIGRNPDYYSTDIVSDNWLSDFNGKGNTDAIITATDDASNYPAVCACRRYHKGNTKAGDWYLPAAGEGGYLMARLKRINQTINEIYIKLDNTAVVVDTCSDYWLSAEPSDIRVLRTLDGFLYYGSRYEYLCVRGWLRA